MCVGAQAALAALWTLKAEAVLGSRKLAPGTMERCSATPRRPPPPMETRGSWVVSQDPSSPHPDASAPESASAGAGSSGRGCALFRGVTCGPQRSRGRAERVCGPRGAPTRRLLGVEWGRGPEPRACGHLQGLGHTCGIGCSGGAQRGSLGSRGALQLHG